MARRSARLTIAEVRRALLTAQGFADPPPAGRVDVRHLRRVMERVGAIQLDSVNVVARTQHLVPFSRLGPYDTGLFDSMSSPRREWFECVGRATSLYPVEMFPYMQWRVEHTKAVFKGWRTPAVGRYLQAIVDEVALRGPVSAREIAAVPEERIKDPTGRPWGSARSSVRVALSYLTGAGELAVTRGPGFELLYDLPERLIPLTMLRAEPVPPIDAARHIVARAVRSQGVMNIAGVRWEVGLKLDAAQSIVADLAAAGVLEEVSVEGWSGPSYVHHETQIPRSVHVQALVSPFDTRWYGGGMVGRGRGRVFDFEHPIELYEPVAKRRYGYYVLPFLLGDRPVARVDLATDRDASTLRVLAAWLEPDVDSRDVVRHLVVELARLAGFVGAGDIAVQDKGNLAAALATAV